MDPKTIPTEQPQQGTESLGNIKEATKAAREQVRESIVQNQAEYKKGRTLDVCKTIDSIKKQSGLTTLTPQQETYIRGELIKALESVGVTNTEYIETDECKRQDEFLQEGAAQGASAMEEDPSLADGYKAKVYEYLDKYVGKKNRKSTLQFIVDFFGKDGIWGKIGGVIATIFGLKKAGESASTPTPDPTETPPPVTDSPETINKVTKYATLFKSKGLTLDESTFEDDLGVLQGAGIVTKEKSEEEQIKEVETYLGSALASTGGQIKALQDAIGMATSNQPFSFRLKDLLFQKMELGEAGTVQQIVTIIKDNNNSLAKTSAGIRAFLDETLKPNNFDTAIASIKPATPTPTPVATTPAPVPAATASATPAPVPAATASATSTSTT